MAKSCKAERIVAAIVAKMESISSFNTIQRIQPKNEEELSRFASTQLPVAVVLSGLPTPAEKLFPFGTSLQMELPISIIVYAQDNVTPSETMLDLADDIWTELLKEADEMVGYLGGLASQIAISMDSGSLYYPPYVMFSLSLSIQYSTTNKGI